MRTRLFDPLGMIDTSVQTIPIVAGGYTATGLPVQPSPASQYAGRILGACAIPQR